MLKEKFESVKKFVSDHKVELTIGSGLAAVLGASILYQNKINLSMMKLHENETELHKKEVEMIGKLTASIGGLVMISRLVNEDIEALAKHCGLTTEDLIEISLKAKEALAETCKDLIED